MEEDFEIEIISPQAGPQEDFINVSEDVNIVLYGGRVVPPLTVMC